MYIKKCFLSRGMRLKNPLGKWLRSDDKWPWYYSKDYDCLYHISEHGCLEFSRIPHRSHRLIFTKKGIPTDSISKLYRATVFSKGNQWICSGFDDILMNQTNQPSTNQSFFDHLMNLPPHDRWFMEHLDMIDQGVTIAQAQRNREAIAVSDGSFKNEYGTATWVIEGDSSYGRLCGKVIAPGGSRDHSPYRSELTGIYSILIMVNKLCEYYEISDGEIELACDGLSALDKAFSYVSILHVDDSNYDLLGATTSMETLPSSLEISTCSWPPG
jgi:hypothetical protein